MAGYEYRDAMPFENVYLTGIVRDKQRRKMSKTLGNSPDPLQLIAQYGADGVRTGMLFSSPAGNDLLFDEKLCEQGRNFANKIWNAHNLVSSWTVDPQLDAQNHQAVSWFEQRLHQAQYELEDHFAKFRMSDALMTLYKLIWDDFCSWYLEMIKPAYQADIDDPTYQATLNYFDTLMKLLHPFMPFLTEEIWHKLRNREQTDCITVASWPEPQAFDQKVLKQMDQILELVGNIRHTRNQAQAAPKDRLNLYITTSQSALYAPYSDILQKLGGLKDILLNEDISGVSGSNFVSGKDEFLLQTESKLNPEQEKEQLLKELDYTKGFLLSIEKKLSNQGFVNNAPEQVIANERKKQADAEAKIKALEASLGKL